MLTAEQMKELKQVNISKDTEKTKERFRQDYTATSAQVKNEVAELSGQGKNSFYRVAREGTINARLLLAMSKVFT